MNSPTPAIVAQGAARRLPRPFLLALCAAYVLAGFLGRDPWKTADLAAFGYMTDLAAGNSAWLTPTLAGLRPDIDALLPYWLGAWSITLFSSWLPTDLAARLPFGLSLILTLAAVWYATYNLARSPGAQPLAFAFGGEARPQDYARAIADGGLLAFMACLGLAQMAHETTPAQIQLCCTALLLYSLSAAPWRRVAPAIAGWGGVLGLALSGAPAMAVLWVVGGSIAVRQARGADQEDSPSTAVAAGALLLALLLASAIVTLLGLWHWRIEMPAWTWDRWQSLGRLLLWFTWPAWPLTLWTLWRWRARLGKPTISRHLALPLWFSVVAVATTILTASADRSLLLALPALAVLAAFALPTLSRSVGALIDWFTLLFFSGCALVIWIVWIAMQTGVPSQPAANVARLAPGFKPEFAIAPFLIAIMATLAWAWLVKWRVGRHRSALWKSMILPAGGASLCWLLLMTLWLPLLDYARSYAPMVRLVTAVAGPMPCIESSGLSPAQIAAFQFHGGVRVHTVGSATHCPWLLVDRDGRNALPAGLDLTDWSLHGTVRHPANKDEDLLLYRRIIKAGT